MLKRISYLLLLLIMLSQFVLKAQTNDTIPSSTSDVPTVNYTAASKKYYIANIDVTGVEGTMYEDQKFTLVGFSGLSKGQQIQIPGEELSDVVKKFWKHGLFSDIKILQTKVEGDSVWLELRLTDRPRVSDIRFIGMKKGEQEEIEKKLGVVKGNQITPPQISRAEIIIKSFFSDKGFGDAEVRIMQRPDPTQKNQVVLEIEVDKKEKLKVNSINLVGNEALSDRKLKWAMKKTNEKGKLINLFRAKKFVDGLYKEDKNKLIGKYHEEGYRDAEIIRDSVYKHDEKTVSIDIELEEGPLYHIRSINWVGNTHYPSSQLGLLLNMSPGDIYNQKKLQERLISDEDAAVNLYQNNGYLFSNIDPVEINIENDSVDLELRVIEGPKATIKRVIIQGNDRLYEDIIRRELRTKPGTVFSKEDLLRSVREIAQTGHFDPEALSADIGGGISPNPEDGTVDITYPLTSKGNDQIEFSAGWGVTGLVGKLSLRLNNFSLQNLLNPSMHKGIIPQGEGQTLVLSAQTNGPHGHTGLRTNQAGKTKNQGELRQHEGTQHQQHNGQMMQHQRKVEHHADGDEKKSQQHVAEGLDVFFHLMPELGFRDQHAGDKSAQRHRQADGLRHAGQSQCDKKHVEHEEFSRFATCHNHQPATQQLFAEDEHQRQQDDGFEQGLAHRHKKKLWRLRKGRNEDQERNHRQILKEQHAHHFTPVRGTNFHSFTQELGQHGGR